MLASTLERGAEKRRVLDIGCGTGTNLELLREFGEVEGVDGELAAVEICYDRGEERVRHAPGQTLPFPDGAFDLVSLMDVIEHAEDDQDILREAWRVLAPGGLALVTVPAYMWMWGAQDTIAHHHRRYSRPLLLASLARVGFVPLRASYFNTLLFPPIAAARLIRRLLPTPTSVRSDFELNRPGSLNTLLARLFGLEAGLLRRRSLPFGVSIVALAARPRG